MKLRLLDGRPALFQYDTNRYIVIDGDPGRKIDFITLDDSPIDPEEGRTYESMTIPVEDVLDEMGNTWRGVKIPDRLLTANYNKITAYTIDQQNSVNGRAVTHRFSFQITKRPMPTDYVADDSDAVITLTDAIHRAESASEDASRYATEVSNVAAELRGEHSAYVQEASDLRDKARDWAVKEGAVEDGLFSSRHYAETAERKASETIQNAEQLANAVEAAGKSAVEAEKYAVSGSESSKHYSKIAEGAAAEAQDHCLHARDWAISDSELEANRFSSRKYAGIAGGYASEAESHRDDAKDARDSAFDSASAAAASASAAYGSEQRAADLKSSIEGAESRVSAAVEEAKDDIRLAVRNADVEGKAEIDRYIEENRKPYIDNYVRTEVQDDIDSYVDTEAKKAIDDYVGLSDGDANTSKKQEIDAYVDYFGDQIAKLPRIAADVESLVTKIDGKVENAEVVDGYLYLYDGNGDVVGGRLGPFSGNGGSGSASNTEFSVTNTTGWLLKTVALDKDCFVSFRWSSDSEEGFSTGNGTLTIRVAGSTVLTQSIEQGDIAVNLRKYLSAGSNRIHVVISDVEGNQKTSIFTVNVVDLRISSTFDESIAYNGDVQFRYTPVGDVEKHVHILVDGEEVGSQTILASGRQQTFTITGLHHGFHRLTAYYTAEIDGEEVPSNTLNYGIIYAEDGVNDIIVASSWNTETLTQYDMVAIPYYVYNPRSQFAAVTLSVNGEAVANLTDVERTRQVWSYRITGTGVYDFSIRAGEAELSWSFDVAESPIKISAIDSDLVLNLSASNRSNYEENPLRWEFDDIKAQMTGFNLVSDGWQFDDEKNTVLRLENEARVYIPYTPFATDFRASGKTFEFEFSTSNVMNYDTVIAECFSGNRGFRITAQSVMLKSEQSEISTQFKEDEHVRVSFVVEGTNLDRLIYLYINGIISGLVQYPSNDNFQQTAPVGITLGSSECTTDIYNIRVYDNDLDMYQIVNNWIADTQNAALMIDRYEDNSIFDKYGNLVIENLPSYLPYMVVEGPSLPNQKGDKKTVSGYYVNPQHPEKSFTFTNASIDVQGTSSQYYYRKNYKIKFSNFMTGNETLSVYKMREDSIPVNTFTFKADVASSEGANNVELVGIYNDHCPVKTPPQEENDKVRQGIDGFPIVMFWKNGTNVSFLGKYNFNNDKGTHDVFGFTEGDESWETLTNNTRRVLFKDADFSDPSKWLDVDFEARYPEGNTDGSNLAEMAAWVASTDRTAEGLSEAQKEQRLKKFHNEFEQYFDLQDALYYYVFTELFLLADSRAKNSFPTLYKDGKWMWLPYDMDTAIGINNEGKLAYDYSLEDTMNLNGANIFTGQDSVLWNNLRDAFPEEIENMYYSMRTGDNPISYEEVEKKFEEHQSYWSPSIFNEDAKAKYIAPLQKENETMYLEMCQGSKAEQRKWWLFNRFRYMDSKFNVGYARDSYINFRAYASGPIEITPYADIYARISNDQRTIFATERAVRNQVCTLNLDISGGTADDMVVNIYSADQLKSVGDLSAFKAGTIGIAAATKLQELILGSTQEGYTNPNLTTVGIGNNVLLKTLNLANCTNYAQSVDLSGCVSIENVLMEGTKATGLALPNGSTVKKVHLPNTVRYIQIRNQTNITDFQMAGYSNLSTLWIENPSEAIPVMEMVSNMPAGSRLRLMGISMSYDNYSQVKAFFDNLDTMTGLDANGNNVSAPVLTGTVHVGTLYGTELNAIRNRYPDLRVTYDALYATVTFKNGDTTVFTEQVAIPTNGLDYTFTGTNPTKPETDDEWYIFTGWSIDGVNVLDVLHMTEDTTFYAVYEARPVYTVTYMNGDNVIRKDKYYETKASFSYSGSTPLKDPTAQYAYSFIGWNTNSQASTADPDSLKNLNSSRVLYAVFSATLRKYTITFVNASTGSNVTLQSSKWDYGSIPSYSGSTPMYNGTDTDNYGGFIGWNPTIETVTSDKTYVANFEFTGSMLRNYFNKKLTSVSTNAKRITEFKFANQLNLVSVEAPYAEFVGGNAFDYDYNLNGLNLPSAKVVGYYEAGRKSTPNTGFYCGCGEEINLPKAEYVNGIFGNLPVNSSLYNFRLSNLKIFNAPNVKYIGSSAFSVYASSTPTTAHLDSTNYYGKCYPSIEEYNFNVHHISSGTFNGNIRLKSIILGERLRYIQSSNVITGCISLEKLVLESLSVVTIDSSSLGTNYSIVPADGLKIYVPYNLVNEYKSASNWSSFGDKIYPIIYPNNPTSVTITADDCNGYDTNARIHATFSCDGYYEYGELVQASSVTIDFKSEAFERNETDSDITRNLSFSMFGVNSNYSVLQHNMTSLFELEDSEDYEEVFDHNLGDNVRLFKQSYWLKKVHGVLLEKSVIHVKDTSKVEIYVVQQNLGSSNYTYVNVDKTPTSTDYTDRKSFSYSSEEYPITLSMITGLDKMNRVASSSTSGMHDIHISLGGSYGEPDGYLNFSDMVDYIAIKEI